MSWADDVEEGDYIPDDASRTWYRNDTTGDRGFFVRVDGIDQIQLDRPNEVIRRPFISGEWNVEEEHRPLTLAQLGKVAFVADKELMQALGEHELSRREWHALTDLHRSKWMNHGPQPDSQPHGRLRHDLWRNLMMVLKPLAE